MDICGHCVMNRLEELKQKAEDSLSDFSIEDMCAKQAINGKIVGYQVAIGAVMKMIQEKKEG